MIDSAGEVAPLGCLSPDAFALCLCFFVVQFFLPFIGSKV
jgi:hypothetical protein